LIGTKQGFATIVGQNPVSVTVEVRERGVTIRGFTITGPRDGVQVRRGATALIDNNTIENLGGGIEDPTPPSGTGVIVNAFAFARIINNRIRNNLSNGISVSENSSARIGVSGGDDLEPSPNTIQDNAGNGVSVSRSSNARIVGNIVSSNAGHGVQVIRASHADTAANSFNANGGDGIHVSENSGVNLESSGLGETPLFAMPNTTTILNGGSGIGCSIGGYASGPIGTLNGVDGKISFDGRIRHHGSHGFGGRNTCIDNVTR
jgi:parallel beta-helix repeat protein